VRVVENKFPTIPKECGFAEMNVNHIEKLLDKRAYYKRGISH